MSCYDPCNLCYDNECQITLRCDVACAEHAERVNGRCQCKQGYNQSDVTPPECIPEWCDAECGCGQFQEPTSTGYECHPCQDNCEACPDHASCEVCSDEFIYNGNECVCDAWFTENPDPNSDERCICPQGTKKEDGVCVDETYCPALFYGDNCENFCQVENCKDNCGTEGCRSCLWPNISIFSQSANIITCEDCEDGYFWDTDPLFTPSCVECHCPLCRGSPFECYVEFENILEVGCDDGYYVVDGSWLDIVEEGILTYRCARDNTVVDCSSMTEYTPVHQTYIAVDGTCVPCAQECLTCSGDPSSCVTCREDGFGVNNNACSACPSGMWVLHGTYPQPSECHTVCPDGMYYGATDCLACPANCETCAAENECNSCDPGYDIVNYLCAKVCANGTYLDTNDNVCRQCNGYGCKTCESGGTCLECWDVNAEPASLCESCNDRYYNAAAGTGVVEATCVKCQGNCLACQGPTDCSLCPPLMAPNGPICECVEQTILYQGICYRNTLLDRVVAQCPAGEYEYHTYDDNGDLEIQCRICDPSCDTCIGPGPNCLECRNATANCLDGTTGELNYLRVRADHTDYKVY